MTTFRVLLLIQFLLYAATPMVYAENDDDAQATQTVAKTPLREVLDAVSKKSGKRFLINSQVSPIISIGQIEVRRMDYPILLQALRNNDLAAITVDNVVSIVPVRIVRQYPLPAMADADDNLHDEEWITGTMQLTNASAASMVPIMRPMMPQAGHFTANPASNSVVIVDRLGNAKRIFGLIRALDEKSPATAKQPD